MNSGDHEKPPYISTGNMPASDCPGPEVYLDLKGGYAVCPEMYVIVDYWKGGPMQC